MIFQGASVNFSIIQPMVKATVQALQAIKVSPVPHLASLLEKLASVDGTSTNVVLYHQQTMKVSSKQKDDFECVRDEFIDEVVKNLTTSFPQMELMIAMTNLQKDDNELENYGDVELNVLLQHYGKSKTADTTAHPPLVDSTACNS